MMELHKEKKKNKKEQFKSENDNKSLFVLFTNFHMHTNDNSTRP